MVTILKMVARYLCIATGTMAVLSRPKLFTNDGNNISIIRGYGEEKYPCCINDNENVFRILVEKLMGYNCALKPEEKNCQFNKHFYEN